MAGYVGTERTNGTSTANAAQTVSAGGSVLGANDNVRRKVLYILVAYSAAPTQTGVIITVNAGEGPTYDTVLLTGTANVRYTYWYPSSTLVLMGDDSVDVVAPAAGGVITSSIRIVCEGYYGGAD